MADQEINKTIKDYKEDYYYFTGEASKINRNLALAGIAIVWIFRETNGVENSIPDRLNCVIFLLILTLALDLLHYVVGGLMWFIFYKVKEKKIHNGELEKEENIDAPEKIPNTLHVIYWAKIMVNIIAYVLLLYFLYGELIK